MIKTYGIVLREMKYKETSKILSIYTLDRGRISTMVRGVNNPKSPLIANTQPFSLNEYNLREGRSFYYINSADLLESFYSLREDIYKMIYASYMLELVEKSVEENQPNKQIFQLLTKGLFSLAQMEDNYLAFIIAYELKFVSFLGYRPCLDRCVACGGQPRETSFSLAQGGILCEKCFNKDISSRRISGRIYNMMLKLFYSKLDELPEDSLDKEELKALHYILVDYILYNIDRLKFNSLEVLETII